tara:strand:+ start:480 stop:1187 length:708 start_codon:yes stop_codon:yes gene_type:complete
MKKIKTICIIPARGGSKGLKNKNILKINNEYLISRTIKFAKSVKQIDVVLVTTDSKKIAEIAIQSGALVPFLRPKKLASDLATTEDTLRHALLKYEKISQIKFDFCIFLSPTDIFRNKSWPKYAINKMKKNKNLDSIFVGYETHKNYWEKNHNNKWKRLKPWMKEYSSRQIRNKIYREDTGLFSITKSHFWRKGIRLGKKVDIIINKNDLSSIDIHDAKDLKLANLIIENKIEKY